MHFVYGPRLYGPFPEFQEDPGLGLQVHVLHPF